MNKAKIKFIGATKTVTGSCHLVEYDNVKLLIDCGMYQGLDVEGDNYLDFPFNPEEINAVILTHAHLDHCGLLPKLVRLGFKGKIYLNSQTAELTKVILYDSAKLQELKERFENKINEKLYETIDVDKTISLFEIIKLGDNVYINNNVCFNIINSGHVLGSVSVIISIENRKVIFSGDLGRRDQSIIKRFNENNNSETRPELIIMESLYGGERHENRDDDINTLLNTVNDTLRNDGKVILPVFALHRAQEFLELFRILIKCGKLSESTNIYLDSPMAIEITEIYKNNYLEFNDHYRILQKDIIYSSEQTNDPNIEYNADRFEIRQLQNVNKIKRSQRISNAGPGIIMAGSGMADGGRVVRHIMNNIEDPKNTIIFVGYQAEGTLGNLLVNGIKKVQIRGKEFKVNAKILYLRGFSAHGDNDDLLAWLDMFNRENLKEVFLVHGEPDRMQIFSRNLDSKGLTNYIPDRGYTYEMD